MGYGRKFHLKRKDNPRYQYIAKSLLAASDSDHVSRKTFLDIGSSIGCLLKEIATITNLPKGCLYGVDYGSVVKEEFFHDECTYVEKDLTHGEAIIYPGNIDVIICQEVAEHIPEESVDTLISSIAINLSPDGILLWKAAPPGQRGKGHVNLQSFDYWEREMGVIGLVVNSKKTEVYRKTMDEIVPDKSSKEMSIYRESVIFSPSSIYKARKGDL